MPPAADVIGLYERHAKAYDADRGRSLFEKAWLDRFAALLPRGGRILDLGCGMGVPIARYFIAQGFDVTGVDSSASLIAKCRERFPAQHWLATDMRTLSLHTTFDGIVAWDSFFHLSPDDQHLMFSVFARHAAKTAALIFTSGPTAGVAIGSYRGDSLYHASLNPEEYRAVLRDHGFAVVRHIAEDTDCGNHTVWLAQRRN